MYRFFHHPITILDAMIFGIIVCVIAAALIALSNVNWDR